MYIHTSSQLVLLKLVGGDQPSTYYYSEFSRGFCGHALRLHRARLETHLRSHSRPRGVGKSLQNITVQDASWATMVATSSVIGQFRQGQMVDSGTLLAASLTPVSPQADRYRMRDFYNAFDGSSLAENDLVDIRIALFRNLTLKLPRPEQNCWIELFYAYWKTVGEILKLDSGSWEAVFEEYKGVANALIRAYTTGGMESWTLPCIYVVGKYLRIFAIRADNEIAARNSTSFRGRFEDDVISDTGNAKLEEAARTLNRLFTLCLFDR